MHLHFRHKNLEIYTPLFTGKVSFHFYILCYPFYVQIQSFYFKEYFSHIGGPELNQNDNFEYETIIFF